MKNEQLINFRKERDFTTESMAKKLGISRSLYEKVEYGQRQPSFNFMKRFKTAFPEANADVMFLN